MLDPLVPASQFHVRSAGVGSSEFTQVMRSSLSSSCLQELHPCSHLPSSCFSDFLNKARDLHLLVRRRFQREIWNPSIEDHGRTVHLQDINFCAAADTFVLSGFGDSSPPPGLLGFLGHRSLWEALQLPRSVDQCWQELQPVTLQVAD